MATNDIYDFPSTSHPIRLWPATPSRPLMPIEVGGLCYLSDLENRETSFALQKTLFLGFPQVVAGGKEAHYEAIGWSISRQAVIVNRDIFSAGGRRRLELFDGNTYDGLPAVIGRAIAALGRDCPVSLRDLSEIHNFEISTAAEAIEAFRTKLLSMRDFGETQRILLSLGLPRSESQRLIVMSLVSAVSTGGFID